MRGHVFNGISMIILSVLLAVIFAGCAWQKDNVPKLSGTYYLVDDIWRVTEASITFYGDNFTLLVDGEKLEGKMLYNTANTASHEDGSKQANVVGALEDWYNILVWYEFSDQKEINVDFTSTSSKSGYGRFVKKGSIANSWWIIAVIVIVIITVVGTLYKKKTGRNLSDDTGKVIDKVKDKVGNIINNTDKKDDNDDST